MSRQKIGGEVTLLTPEKRLKKTLVLLNKENEVKNKLKSVLKKYNVDLDKEVELQNTLNEWILKATQLARAFGY